MSAAIGNLPLLDERAFRFAVPVKHGGLSRFVATSEEITQISQRRCGALHWISVCVLGLSVNFFCFENRSVSEQARICLQGLRGRRIEDMAWRPMALGGVAALLLAREVYMNIRKKRAEASENEDEVDYKFLSVAAKEAETAMRNKEGGPFGAVIVRDGEIVAQAHNEVLKTKDPTAHAEILAIQKVCHLQMFASASENCIINLQHGTRDYYSNVSVTFSSAALSLGNGIVLICGISRRRGCTQEDLKAEQA